MFDFAHQNAHLTFEGEEVDTDVIFGDKQQTLQDKVEKLRQRFGESILANESTSLLQGEHNNLYEEKNMQTHVPFLLYKVLDPNMRNISQEYLNIQDYKNWTETKFFKFDQIQEVICTEYPDNQWMIDEFNRKFLMIDIVKALEQTLS